MQVAPYGLPVGTEQVPAELPDGSILGPDGKLYRRTGQRLRRRSHGDVLVAAGAAVVTDVYPDGLPWYAGSAAATAWAEIAPRLVSGRRPRPDDLRWVGRVWESDMGSIMLRFDGEH